MTARQSLEIRDFRRMKNLNKSVMMFLTFLPQIGIIVTFSLSSTFLVTFRRNRQTEVVHLKLAISRFTLDSAFIVVFAVLGLWLKVKQL